MRQRTASAGRHRSLTGRRSLATLASVLLLSLALALCATASTLAPAAWAESIYWTSATGAVGKANCRRHRRQRRARSRRRPTQRRSRRQPRLLDDQQRHDRPRQPRRHQRRESFITGASYPQGIAVDANLHLLDERRRRHDRPRQPRRHQRRPELHHAAPLDPQGVTVDASHVYWTNTSRARSAAPTSTAPA